MDAPEAAPCSRALRGSNCERRFSQRMTSGALVVLPVKATASVSGSPFLL